MRIIQLTPGSGDNFYCENCLRDIAVVRALRSAGHEVLLVPMYLPLQIRNPEPLESGPLFFGGINVYLQQKLNVFRHIPGWLDRWLDSPVLLRRIAKLSSMTRARDLGEMTLSMLAGADGRQAKEIDRLAAWLESQAEKADVILLSNALLSGLAEPLQKRLKTPVACLLQDEDGFVDGLGQPWAEQVWGRLRENAGHIAHFVSVSRYYQEVMAERLKIPAEKISVVYTGVDCETFTPAPPPQMPTIGYLARMCKDNGLDILVNALFMLRRDERFAQAQLRVTGGSLGSDKVFMKKLRRRIASQHLTSWVHFEENYSQQARREFLNRVSVVSVPARKPMAYGLFALEAMACGVPFVQPATGVFCELAEMGGGVLYEQNNPVHLAEMLRGVLSESTRLSALRAAARKTAETTFAIEKTGANLIACLKQVKGAPCSN